MQKEILEKIEKLNEKEAKVVSSFIDNLTKKTDLLPVFEEKLKTIKNNPVDEPKIQEKQKQIEEKALNGEIEAVDALLEIIEGVYTIEEIEAIEKEHKLELSDLVKFGGAVSEKVFSFKETIDGAEVFKEVSSQNDLKPVPYSKKREIREQIKKIDKALKEYTEYASKEKVKDAKLAELEQNIKEEEKLLDIKIKNSHNLDTSNMSKWELELLKQKVIANSYGSYMPPMGKRLVP